MIECRDTMRAVIPNAFHHSDATIKERNENFGLNIPVPIPMSQAWIVVKMAVLNSDYKHDVGFFKF